MSQSNFWKRDETQFNNAQIYASLKNFRSSDLGDP
jgi:predicted ribosome quality control (RQC) complex YloA/Tae2 family protein